MSPTPVALAAEGAVETAALEHLALELKLPIQDLEAAQEGLLLVLTPMRLELRQLGPQAPGPVFCDFVGGRLGHRRRFGGGRGQPLARALGLKKGRSPKILDATAGLGRDAFILASLGCELHLIERSPIIAALLQDGLARAAKQPALASIIGRMRLEQADSLERLPQLLPEERPEMIYLDPMYPPRQKSALVKKEMRLFQQLLGDDLGGDALLSKALAVALKRVVVKRPLKAPPLRAIKPYVSLKSRNTRYDIYPLI